MTQLTKRPSFLPTVETVELPEVEQKSAVKYCKLLQAMSPELIEGDEKYHPDAKSGKYILGDVVFKEATVQVLQVKLLWKEWSPEGLKGIYESAEDAALESDPTSDVKKSMDFMVRFLDGDAKGETGIFSFAMDKYSKAESAELWLSKLKTACAKQEAPETAFSWTISSIMKKGKKGSWHQTSVALKGWVNDDEYEQAQNILESQNQALMLEEKAQSVNI